MRRRERPRGRSLEKFVVAGSQYMRLSIPLVRFPAALTAAEREVASLLLEGKSNAQIAEARGVSMRTVANQVASILRKLDVDSRSALLARLMREAL